MMQHGDAWFDISLLRPLLHFQREIFHHPSSNFSETRLRIVQSLLPFPLISRSLRYQSIIIVNGRKKYPCIVLDSCRRQKTFDNYVFSIVRLENVEARVRRERRDREREGERRRDPVNIYHTVSSRNNNRDNIMTL